jgi:hypothetical protein
MAGPARAQRGKGNDPAIHRHKMLDGRIKPAHGELEADQLFDRLLK